MNNETKKPTQYDAFFDVVTSVMETDWDFLKDVIEFTMSDLEKDLEVDTVAITGEQHFERVTRYGLEFLLSKLDKNYKAIDKVIEFQNEHIRVPDGDDDA